MDVLIQLVDVLLINYELFLDLLGLEVRVGAKIRDPRFQRGIRACELEDVRRGCV